MTQAGEQSAIFSRLLDMQKEYNDKIGGIYDVLRENAKQDAQMIASLNQTTQAVRDLVSRLEETERLKHETPCKTACTLEKDVEKHKGDIEAIRAALNKIEQEKMQRRKDWKEITMHVVKYAVVAAAVWTVALLTSGFGEWMAKLTSGGLK